MDGWWSGQKLSHAQYSDYSALFRCGHSKRKRDVEEVLRSERGDAIGRHLGKESRALSQSDPDKPMREFPETAAFAELFRSPQRRRPILVIVGGTNLGKSMLAASVLRSVGEVLRVPSFLEITVEDDVNLDLAEFDVDQHAGVLLDGVGDVLMLKRHREALQGRVKSSRGGRSATMMYSYPFTLCRRAVVATMDLSAKNLDMFVTDHWFSNPSNVALLRLGAPVWVGGDAAIASTSSPMSAWSVEEVGAWLDSKDMAGPAALLRGQGVNGKDLLAWETAEDMRRELGTTPFVATKVMAWRQEHVASA